jgi:ATP synthase protein I
LKKDDYSRNVGEKARRKIKARKKKEDSILFGLGTFGIVGWSVAVPAIIGIIIGVWLDSKGNKGYSWTLMLLIAGIIIGCINAWLWISGHSKDEDEENDGEE